MIATIASPSTSAPAPVMFAVSPNGAGSSANDTLTSRAVLVDLTIRQWSAAKHDRDVSREVARQHGSEESMGSYRKLLLAADALRKVRAAANAAAEEHRKRTLPWLDNGAGRVLLNAGYFKYVAAMNQHKDAFYTALDEFEQNYAAYKGEAQRALGSLYDPNDYPPAASVRGRFALGWTIDPLPDAGDFRVALGDAEVARLRHRYEETMQERIQDAQREVTERVRETVQHIAQRLAEYVPSDQGGTGRLHESMVENVRELARLLPTLNIAADPALDTLATQLRDKVGRFSTQTLKDSTAARQSVINAADEILEKMEDYL